jgi:hypothetical protein
VSGTVGSDEDATRSLSAVAMSDLASAPTNSPTPTPTVSNGSICYELAESTPIALKPNTITIIKPNVAMVGRVTRVSVHLNFTGAPNLSGVKSALLIDAEGNVANLWASGGLCASRTRFAGGNIDSAAVVSISAASACSDGSAPDGYTQSYRPYDDFQSTGIVGSLASPKATAANLVASPWQLRLITSPSSAGSLTKGQLCVTTDQPQPASAAPSPTPTPAH